MKVTCLPGTSTLNYQDTVNLLRSKAVDSEEAKLFEEDTKKFGARFFDGKGDVPNVIFASFPRSGNSLTRKIIEDVSGVITGSNITN